MKRPSASLIVATAALFLALGGTGLAASDYVITSKGQIKPSVLKNLEKRGPRGFQGLQGKTGLTGAAGKFNTSDVTVVNGPTVTFAGASPGQSTAVCPTGDTVIGGGFQSVNGPNIGSVSDDGPSGTIWTVRMTSISQPNGGGGEYSTSGQFYAQAICAS